MTVFVFHFEFKFESFRLKSCVEFKCNQALLTCEYQDTMAGGQETSGVAQIITDEGLTANCLYDTGYSVNKHKLETQDFLHVLFV